MRFFLTIILTILSLQNFAQQVINIYNNQPRKDDKGKIVDAHDGRVIRFGNKFYWYGTSYKTTNGFTTANKYVSYSSTDLKNWVFEGPLLPHKPAGVYYRPHVVYNKKTEKYILWYNWNPKLWDGQFGVAESKSPIGPFKIINSNAKVKYNNLGVGDLGVFVDEDGTAYLSYNTIKGHRLSVEQLDETYTKSTLKGSEFIANDCEAGSMFKRNGLYYLLTDYTCCFCTQGSGAQVFTANNPLGPFTYRQNINRHPGVLSAVLSNGESRDNFFEPMLPKEKNGIEAVLQQPETIDQISIYQFTGNRNGQCGEVNNPRVHDLINTIDFKVSYFLDGEWQNLNQDDVKVEKSSTQNKYIISFKSINPEKLKIDPVYIDSTSIINISEIDLHTIMPFKAFKTGTMAGKPIIPAQQGFVMELKDTQNITQYIWMGDLWGSSSENIKGEDYQYWSSPMKFYKNGLIETLQWDDEWQLEIKD